MSNKKPVNPYTALKLKYEESQRQLEEQTKLADEWFKMWKELDSANKGEKPMFVEKRFVVFDAPDAYRKRLEIRSGLPRWAWALIGIGGAAIVACLWFL